MTDPLPGRFTLEDADVVAEGQDPDLPGPTITLEVTDRASGEKVIVEFESLDQAEQLHAALGDAIDDARHFLAATGPDPDAAHERAKLDRHGIGS